MEFLAEIRRELMEQLGQGEDWSDEEIRDKIDELVIRMTRKSSLTVTEKAVISRELFCSVRKLDVLQELLDDDSVTEIMVNGHKNIFVERDGKRSRWDKSFTSREKLEDVIQQIAGKCNRVINENQPIVDARLSGGQRVNAVISPVALDGPVLTIRRFPDRPITMDWLIRKGSITREAAGFLEKAVRAGYSILIGGGTSSGKTTFLNALSNYIPPGERLITIEDNAELQIQGVDNLVRLEAKMANMEGGREITIRDLIRTALRMAPNRIIVGEIRGEEAIDLLQAWNTGHDGSMGTAHANSSRDMISRVETMVLMGMTLPLEAIRRQIASGIDLMVHLGRLQDKSRRVLEITEVLGFADGQVKLKTLFEWDMDAGRLIKRGDLVCREKMKKAGEEL
ncbi:MAG TPA: CpaF family protein [Candidatus Pullilachnospira intestinigallinarum]|nr:CpaF family protein [Candidatus Pullilachnospira intestinigallinarum]